MGALRRGTDSLLQRCGQRFQLLANTCQMDGRGHSLHAVLVEIGHHDHQCTELLLLVAIQTKSRLIGQQLEDSQCRHQ